MPKNIHPKFLITGGLDGLGNGLVEYFRPGSRGISRRNGYDINTNRDKIVDLARSFDVFVNLANSGFNQALMLYDIFNDWEKIDKKGYIINVGSYGTYNPGDAWRPWLAAKFALDIANKQCCKKIEEKNLPFRSTNIRFGMLDTDKSRAKPNWEGVGHRAEDIAKLIIYLWSQFKSNAPYDFNEITVNNIKNNLGELLQK